MTMDRAVAQWVADQGWNRKPFGLHNKHWIVEVLKAPGEYLLAIIVAVLLAVFYRRRQTDGVTRWQAAGLVLAAGAVSGLNSLLKWIAGRRRPVVGVDPFNYELFVGGWGGLTGAEKNLAFPSGHAATAFAVASALAVLLPRYKWFFYGAATLTAIERFAENAHYLSDSVVGAAVGCLSTFTVVKIFEAVQARREKRRVMTTV
jgi:membrane-associated phospholipid phosphatase